MFYVILFDESGHEMAAHYDIDGMKTAKTLARDYLIDPEYVSDATRVEVRDSGTDECIWDKRVRG